MKASFVFWAAALAALLVASAIGPAGAQIDSCPGIPLRLDSGSELQRGCFDRCLCPIMMVPGLRGRLALTPAGHEGQVAVFAVHDVAWWAHWYGTSWKITGQGTYRIDRVLGLQRLELDLEISDEPTEHFDSGWVLAPKSFPHLEITISMNEMICYDTVFVLRAAPLRLSSDPVADVLPELDSLPSPRTSWGTLKALYRR